MKAIIPSYNQIKRGLQIYEQIEQLQQELANLFGVRSAEQVPSLLPKAGAAAPAKRRGRPPKTISTGKRGRRKAGQAPEASSEGEDAKPKKGSRKSGSAAGKKPKRKITEAHRQAIIAAQKKRWAAVKGE